MSWRLIISRRCDRVSAFAPVVLRGSVTMAQFLRPRRDYRGRRSGSGTRWSMLAADAPSPSRPNPCAEQAAGFINGAARAAPAEGVRTADLSEIPLLASHVLVAVADQGIGPVADALAAAGMRTGIALHTCGAKGPDALQALGAAGVSCGMLHPLQTLITAEQGARSLIGVTFGLAGDPRALEWGDQIVTSLHGHPLRLDADRLSYYHAGAVMASNALLAALMPRSRSWCGRNRTGRGVARARAAGTNQRQQRV